MQSYCVKLLIATTTSTANIIIIGNNLLFRKDILPDKEI